MRYTAQIREKLKTWRTKLPQKFVRPTIPAIVIGRKALFIVLVTATVFASIVFFTLRSQPGDMLFGYKQIYEELTGKSNDYNYMIDDRMKSLIDLTNANKCVQSLLAEAELSNSLNSYFTNSNFQTHAGSNDLQKVYRDVSNVSEMTGKCHTNVNVYHYLSLLIINQLASNGDFPHQEVNEYADKYKSAIADYKKEYSKHDFDTQEALSKVSNLLQFADTRLITFNNDLAGQQVVDPGLQMLVIEATLQMIAQEYAESDASIWTPVFSAICNINPASERCNADELEAIVNSLDLSTDGIKSIESGEALIMEFMYPEAEPENTDVN